MNDIKLNYPIKLYMKKSIMLFAMVFCIFMTWASYYTYGIAVERDKLFLLAFSLVGMPMFAFLTLTCLASLFLNQPTITITPSSIELFHLFTKNKQIFWSQIETIELEEYTHKSVKHWLLIIFPKQGYGKKIVRPLKRMTYNDIQLNEKEIFAIIEQSFKGEQPTYKSIEMGLENRMEFGSHFWKVILVIIFLIFLLAVIYR